jgi:hypothetical protein
MDIAALSAFTIFVLKVTIFMDDNTASGMLYFLFTLCGKG